MRRPGFAAPGLLIAATLLLAALVGGAPVAARQATPPAAGTPTVPPPTETAAPPVETPAAATPAAAAPAAPVATDVVTLAFWYANAADQDIINLFPLSTDAGFVAGPQAGAGSVGTADFPVEGVPSITIGETTFTTYPRPDGVIERWTWIDDFEGARPGTLVMQVSGAGGAYQDFFGAATFISRDEGGAGGLLVIALRPPQVAAEPAADDAAAEAPAEAAPADDAVAADAAIAPEITAEPGDVTLPEPDVEVPTEGEAVTEPAA